MTYRIIPYLTEEQNGATGIDVYKKLAARLQCHRRSLAIKSRLKLGLHTIDF